MAVFDASYNYQKPGSTYTLDQFIACQSDDDFCYNNLSFIDQIDNIQYCVYNVVSDYIDEIIDSYCRKVQLSDEEMMKYMYRPKLLCYDIYGFTELHFLIMLINDMCSVKDFDKNLLYLPTKDNMTSLCRSILNANKTSIMQYNDANIKTSEEFEEKIKESS